MATKKAATTKKSAKPAPKAVSKSAAAKSSTKVTTVKAVESRPRSSARLSASRLNLRGMPLISASIAEFVGTFLLVCLILTTRNEPIYLMFGLVGIALAVAALSGAHLNPAVTIGAWVTRKLTNVRALVYLLGQVLGAMLAFVVVSSFVNAAPEVSEQAAAFGQQAAQMYTLADIPEGKEWSVFFAELLGLAILGFGYASVVNKRRSAVRYAFTIGASLFVAIWLAGTLASYVTGAVALNPAAAISVQALEWELWPLLVYVVAPIVGSVVGFGLYRLLDDNTSVEAVKA